MPRLSTSRRSPAAVLATVVLAAVALAGCGDAPAPAGSRAARPELPFPPRAAEPPASTGSHAPAGRVVRIGGRPEGIAIDGATGALAVATNGLAPSLAILDARTLRPRRTVALPASARHVQAGGGEFLVPLETADRVGIVPAARGGLRLAEAGDEPHDAARVGRDLVVGDEFGGTATIVRGGRIRATVPVDVQPGGVARVDDHTAAIVSVRAYTVALLDLRTLRVGPSQNAGYGPSHVVATADGRVFIADTRGGAVLEYATRPRLKAVRRLAGLGAPYGLAFDDARARLWVTDVRGARLLAIAPGDASGDGLRVVRSWPAVAQPNSVAVDPRDGAAVVAGERGGLLQRVAAPAG